jgi:hypothetical protein
MVVVELGEPGTPVISWAMAGSVTASAMSNTKICFCLILCSSF